jgi:cytochrome P450
VTAHVLGLPTDDIERVGRWGFELLHSTWPETNRTERGVGLAGAFPEFARFLDEQIALRRRTASPPDDLLTSMVGAADAGTVLSDVQVRTLAANCLLASQSTANLVGNLLHRFASDAAFERRLRADRELAPAAIEESLRFEPPVLFLFRTARYDTELSGEKIRAGERMILGIASGNRDEDVYERADEFWIGRWPGAAQHLTFGPGPHLCLGNQLARMEARVVLELVMDLFPEGALRLAPGYRRRHVPMFLEYGPGAPRRRDRRVKDQRAGANAIGACATPRVGTSWFRTTPSSITSQSGIRDVSAWSATRVSIRATALPRQWWTPWPNAQWARTSRSRSSTSASSNTASS